MRTRMTHQSNSALYDQRFEIQQQMARLPKASVLWYRLEDRLKELNAMILRSYIIEVRHTEPDTNVRVLKDRYVGRRLSPRPYHAKVTLVPGRYRG